MGGGGGVNSTSFTGIQFRQTFKEDSKCLFLCIVFYYEYQYQAFPGLIRRVFIIQFVTASHREQFEVLLELYIDPGTSQVDPRTLLPGNISS